MFTVGFLVSDAGTINKTKISQNLLEFVLRRHNQTLKHKNAIITMTSHDTWLVPVVTSDGG